MDRSNEVSQLRRMLANKSLWLKKSSEGANSLFRSVSVSLYFTEKYHELIRALILSYFNIAYKPRLVNDFQLKTMERYLENMFLFEFEPLNLDILSKLFDAQIDLYFLENSELKKEVYHHEGKLQLKLARLSEHSYSALFSRNQKESFSFAQNIVLSLIDSVCENKREFQFLNANNGKLINFDFNKWLSQSDLADHNDPALIDYQKYLLFSIVGSTGRESVGHARTEVCETATQRLNGIVCETAESNKPSNPSVAKEILSLFKRRKNSNSTIGANAVNSKQCTVINCFPTRAMFLNNNHCNARKLKSKSAISKRTSVKSKKVDLFGDLGCSEIKEESKVSIFQLQSTDIDKQTDCESSMRNLNIDNEFRKCSTVDDFSAFKDRVFVSFGKNDEISGTGWVANDSPILLGKPSGRKLRQSGSSEKKFVFQPSVSKEGEIESGEGTKDQKNNKISIKERLKKKNELLMGKLELNKQFSANEAMFNVPKVPVFADHKNSSSLSLETRHDSTQKLLSELKFNGFNKEKYSEIVDNHVFQGYIKFFDEKNGFGFFQIVKENAVEDIFVYKSEFDKAGIKTESFKHIKNGFIPTFAFQIAVYFVGTDRKKKAINIRQV